MAAPPTPRRIAPATTSDPARIATSFSPSPSGDSVNAVPKNM